MNPFLQFLQALAPPMPPQKPPGLGQAWGQGVPEHLSAAPQGTKGYAFPNNQLGVPGLIDPNAIDAMSWNKGRAKAGGTPITEPRQNVLTPEMLMLLLSTETLR